MRLSRGYMINHNENDDENEKIDHIDTAWANLLLDMDTHILNKSVSTWWSLYVISTDSATFDA